MNFQQDAWCSKEFNSIKLGDERLNRRLLKVANDLMNHPDVPIHSACHRWSEAKAAYRLFDNDKLKEAVLYGKGSGKNDSKAWRIFGAQR